MRSGALISVVAHVVLVVLALFGAPKLFDGAATQTIEVDLVRSDEVEPPKPQPEPEKQATWDPPENKPEPWPESKPPTYQPNPQQPDSSQQAALTPQRQPAQQNPPQSLSPGPAPEQAQPPPQPTPSIFDPANIPALMNLPNAPDRGFDAEATTAANLTPDERAAFRAHLRKCWKLPAGLSTAQTTRVVLRVYLKRDGKLASEPVLIEASASRDGPAVLQAAQRALKDCQPYAFLPAEKFSEWRVLDLPFSPRDMAGG